MDVKPTSIQLIEQTDPELDLSDQFGERIDFTLLDIDS